jgi:AP-2 complex subunit alpha
VNLFPEIKPQLLQMFQFYSHSPDSELQQRACEYLTVATMPSDDLLRTICDEMPPFAERASILLQRLHKRSVGTSERRTWLVGGKDANPNNPESLIAQQTGLKRSFTTIVNGTQANPTTNGTLTKTGMSNGGSSRDLIGLDMNGHKDSTLPNLASATHLSPDWEIGYEQMYFSDESVLYEDPQIQVGLRAEYRGHLGVVKIYFTNKASFPIGSFTTTLDNKSAPNLKVDTKSLPDSSVAAGSQAQQTIVCTSIGPYTEPPTIRISYLAGALQAYTLKLPILPHRFMDPSELSADDFFKRWKQIGAGAMEAQSTFGLRSNSATMSEKYTREIVTGFRWRILDNVDPNPQNIVGCAVYQLEKGKTGCLLRLEPNTQQKVRLECWSFFVGVTNSHRCTV